MYPPTRNQLRAINNMAPFVVNHGFTPWEPKNKVDAIGLINRMRRIIAENKKYTDVKMARRNWA
jgi:hypothetical protein